MNDPDLFDESNEATYCPEDNKLRLYVGRVPREEYLALKAEGWTSTPKQDCDFVATWTPKRRDTCISYAGVIGDEDQSPQDRAADRAERFAEYRDKRTGEATERADRFESGPQAHGYQSQARAERAASRHDRIGDRAVDAWGKAEYWQRRTAGVISHALYVSSPGVRMGRIKKLESELRQRSASRAHYIDTFRRWKAIEAEQDPERATTEALKLTDNSSSRAYDYKHPRPETEGVTTYVKEHGTSLYGLLSDDVAPITGHEAAALYLARNPKEPAEKSEWMVHLELRIAYENQMLAAQGGRLESADAEIEVGGKLGGRLITKVNKSPATKRVTSVSVLGPRAEGWAYKTRNIPGTEYAEYQIDTERLSPDAYKAPTDESRAELKALKAAIKAAKSDKPKAPSLINPTDEDAERLQTALNERAKERHEAANRYGDFEPCPVRRMTQAEYSAKSKGAYSRAETRGLCRGAELEPRKSNMWTRHGEEAAKRRGPALCKVRTSDNPGLYSPQSVVVITDKPQKPLPAAVWEPQAQPETTPA